MQTQDQIRAIVSDISGVQTGEWTAAAALSGSLATSLGRARLAARLQSELGITHPGIYTAASFGELCAVAGASLEADTNDIRPAAPVAALPGIAHVPQAGSIGVDMQAASALPDVLDHWEDAFYQRHFTGGEIAYCLLQPDPRESFAATWCAKEALRKADARWMGADWTAIEVIHDDDGKPSLHGNGAPLPCSLSLSHTNGTAVAVVLFTGQAASETRPAMLPASIAPAAILPSNAAGSSEQRSLVLAALALLCSLATAAYSLLR
jgi:phosphopantetheine--protein transferase-like protein